MAGPGDEIAVAQGRGRGDLRASHADREQVIGPLKAAFVQGRLTKDEFDTRVGQAFASRTYAELAEVTADIPSELTGAQRPLDPWRATKIAWRFVYAIILPGFVAAIILPGEPAILLPGRPTMGLAIILTAVVYLLFWILGVSVMIASRPGKRPSG